MKETAILSCKSSDLGGGGRHFVVIYKGCAPKGFLLVGALLSATLGGGVLAESELLLYDLPGALI